ncbi:hypothetical protein MMC15_002048 [Xylographa vitiligo]|nr:hypothetical protein [Xylographa vitiligo]
MASSRDTLPDRRLPQMTLSDGSLTGPPLPLSDLLDGAGRAQQRFEVKGNAIITGGAGTLALEAARALLEHGLAGLALFDINPSQSERAAKLLREDFPTATIITKAVDVTDAVSVKSATAETSEELGSVDILCCFAGIVGCTHAIDMSPDEWRQTLEINTTGHFLCAQAAARCMISQQTGGSIVLIASISAHRVNFPQPQVAYNVSKSAVIHMAHCLAAEWARYGIRVNTISPGYMDTILNEGAGLEEARNIWASRNPMGRMGSPQELTGPVVLLCSRAGSYFNGADLVMDGEPSNFSQTEPR